MKLSYPTSVLTALGTLGISQVHSAFFPAVFELSSLTNDTSQAGIVINGIDAGDYSGNSVSSAGDINGDGIDDLIIGAYGADPNGDNYAGESYVVFGKRESFSAALELSSLNGSNGFRLNGIDASDFSGNSVSSAGDINGDGVDDLIIGAYRADPNGVSSAGESYVVFGKRESFSAALELSSLNGSDGFRLNGIDANDFSGSSVSSAGDINGDGIDDLIIGASGADPNGVSSAGESYVVFGKRESFSAALELSSLNGSNGFRLNGIDAGDNSGRSVSSAGDINGDGIDDLIIGAYGADPNGDNDGGESYVVFGKRESFSAALELSSLNGSNGFRLNGIDAGDNSGRSVSSAGDINGDGIDDLIIGAYGADPNGDNDGGESYVVFGKRESFSAALELSSLNGSNGFRLNGIDAGDNSGRSVSSTGDINGDGIDDLIIGAYGADPNGDNDGGESYVVFGKRESFSAALELSSLNGSDGFRLNGIDANDDSGRSVSSAGDINGDGIDDLIIGTYGAGNAGESYVVFGRDYSPDGDFTANSAPDLLVRKGKALSILPLAIDSNQVVSAELPAATDLSLPVEITPSANKLVGARDFDDVGVTDFLVKESKDKLKLFRLVSSSSTGQPLTPKVLSQIDFTLPKKHRYVGAGALIAKKSVDDQLDLVLKKGKELFVAENLGNSFSTNLQAITGKLEKGRVVRIQKERVILQRGKRLLQQPINNLALGAVSELGVLAKGQKALLALDINQDGKLDILTQGKKRSIGFVSEENLSATPTAIVTLAKGQKVVGPK